MTNAPGGHINSVCPQARRARTREDLAERPSPLPARTPTGETNQANIWSSDQAPNATGRES